MVDFDAIMKDVYAAGIISSAVVVKKSGDILYASKDWTGAIEKEDVKKCIEDWQGHNRFVKLKGEKYSLLNNSTEYFSACNVKDKSWLVGASSPEGAEEKCFIIGFALAGKDGKNAYIDVARAVMKLKSGTYKDPKEKLGKYSKDEVKTRKQVEEMEDKVLELADKMKAVGKWKEE